MPADLSRRCELAAQLDNDPSLLQNHLHCKMPEWLHRNRGELMQVRAASLDLAAWLQAHPSNAARSLSNARFIEKLEREISLSDSALAIYRRHGWVEPAAAPVQPGPAELAW